MVVPTTEHQNNVRITEIKKNSKICFSCITFIMKSLDLFINSLNNKYLVNNFY